VIGEDNSKNKVLAYDNSIINKIICITLLLTFSWQQIAWAQGGVALKAQPSEAEPWPVSIPKELGITQQVEEGASDEVVINIQDAHDSIPAQYSIVNILDNLNKNYELQLISVEGSAGYLDTSILKSFPDKDVREKVAKYLLFQGKLAAAEYYSITTDEPVLLYGIEDKALYKQNVALFQSSIKDKDKHLKNASSLIKALSKLEGRVYSKELKLLNKNSSLYREGSISFNKYWPYLKDLADKNNISHTHYENLNKLISTVELEGKIDFDKTNTERELLIEELKKYLSKKELKDLIIKAISFKDSKITPNEFYNYLKGLAETHNIEPGGYKNLYQYTEYVTLYETLDIISLHHEITAFESDIKAFLFKTEDEKRLNTLSYEAQLIKELFSLELTNGRLKYLLENLPNLNPERFISFIKIQYKTHSLRHEHSYDIAELFDTIKEAVKFYQVALKRDEKIAENTLNAMREKQTKITALVTGGFHTEGILKVLNDNDVSTLVVLPQFDTEGEKRPYATILSKRNTDQLAHPSFVDTNQAGYTPQETREHVVRRRIQLPIALKINQAIEKGRIRPEREGDLKEFVRTRITGQWLFKRDNNLKGLVNENLMRTSTLEQGLILTQRDFRKLLMRNTTCMLNPDGTLSVTTNDISTTFSFSPDGSIGIVKEKPFLRTSPAEATVDTTLLKNALEKVGAELAANNRTIKNLSIILAGSAGLLSTVAEAVPVDKIGNVDVELYVNGTIRLRPLMSELNHALNAALKGTNMAIAGLDVEESLPHINGTLLIDTPRGQKSCDIVFIVRYSSEEMDAEEIGRRRKAVLKERFKRADGMFWRMERSAKGTSMVPRGIEERDDPRKYIIRYLTYEYYFGVEDRIEFMKYARKFLEAEGSHYRELIGEIRENRRFAILTDHIVGHEIYTGDKPYDTMPEPEEALAGVRGMMLVSGLLHARFQPSDEGFDLLDLQQRLARYYRGILTDEKFQLLLDQFAALREPISGLEEFIQAKVLDHLSEIAERLKSSPKLAMQVIEHLEELRDMHKEDKAEAEFVEKVLAELSTHSSPAENITLDDLDLSQQKIHGKGRFGVIYIIPHKETGQPYAVKRLKLNNDATEPELRHMAQYTLSLSDQHGELAKEGFMPLCYSTGTCSAEQGRIIPETKGRRAYPYIIMDYIPGDNLLELVKEIEKLGGNSDDVLRRKLNMALSTAKTVSVYHEHGLLIKDLKPTNIIVRPDFRVCIVDADGIVPLEYNWAEDPDEIPEIVKRSHTPNYAESKTPFITSIFNVAQAQRLFDKRWDMYSFGITLLDMLDHSLLEGEATEAVVGLVSQEAFDPVAEHARIQRRIREYVKEMADGPQGVLQDQRGAFLLEVYRIIGKCIHKDRGERYETMDKVIEDLEACKKLLPEIRKTSPAAEDLIATHGFAPNYGTNNILLDIVNSPPSDKKDRLLQILGFKSNQRAGIASRIEEDGKFADINAIEDVGGIAEGTIRNVISRIKLSFKCQSEYGNAFEDFITLALAISLDIDFTMSKRDIIKGVEEKIKDHFINHRDLLRNKEFLNNMHSYFTNDPQILLSFTYIIASEIRAGPLKPLESEGLFNLFIELSLLDQNIPPRFTPSYKLAAIQELASLDVKRIIPNLIIQLAYYPERTEEDDDWYDELRNGLFRALVGLAGEGSLSNFHAFIKKTVEKQVRYADPRLARVAIEAVAEARPGRNSLAQFLDKAEGHPNESIKQLVKDIRARVYPPKAIFAEIPDTRRRTSPVEIKEGDAIIWRATNSINTIRIVKTITGKTPGKRIFRLRCYYKRGIEHRKIPELALVRQLTGDQIYIVKPGDTIVYGDEDSGDENITKVRVDKVDANNNCIIATALDQEGLPAGKSGIIRVTRLTDAINRGSCKINHEGSETEPTTAQEEVSEVPEGLETLPERIVVIPAAPESKRQSPLPYHDLNTLGFALEKSGVIVDASHAIWEPTEAVIKGRVWAVIPLNLNIDSKVLRVLKDFYELANCDPKTGIMRENTPIKLLRGRGGVGSNIPLMDWFSELPATVSIGGLQFRPTRIPLDKEKEIVYDNIIIYDELHESRTPINLEEYIIEVNRHEAQWAIDAQQIRNPERTRLVRNNIATCPVIIEEPEEEAEPKKKAQPKKKPRGKGRTSPVSEGPVLKETLVMVMPDFSYECLMTRGIFDPKNTLLTDEIEDRKAFFIVDKGIGKESIAQLRDYIENSKIDADTRQNIFIVSGGERVKNGLLGLFYTLWTAFRAWRAGIDRDSVFVLIGGGATIDMSAFSSSIFHRGVDQIKVPTTPLAQADAGISPKNGINFFGIKNLLGTFYPPQCVLIDTLFSKTTPRTLISDALAEITKVTLIKDEPGFEYLKNNYRTLLYLSEVLKAKELNEEQLEIAEELIWLSVQNHLEQIQTNPYEKRDPKTGYLTKPLDYGHAEAHRLEMLTHNRLSHGQAVAIGIAISSHISMQRGYITEDEFDTIIQLLRGARLPTYDRAATVKGLWPGYEQFRQHLGGDLAITLLDGIGGKQEVGDITREELGTALIHLRTSAMSEEPPLSSILPRNAHEAGKIKQSLEFLIGVKTPLKVAMVIPMYNNAGLEDAFKIKVEQLQALKRANPLFEWQIIAVDDGTPGASCAWSIKTLWEEIRTKYASRGEELDPNQIVVEILTPQEKKDLGSRKGGAVLRGFKKALALDKSIFYIGYTDVDTSVNLMTLPLLIKPIYDSKADVAIGSRWCTGAKANDMSLFGTASSRAYNWIVHTLLKPLRKFYDTQRGFKLFERGVIEEILLLAQDRTLAFDTELLLLADRAGHNIREVGISFFESRQPRTFSTISEAPNMLRSLLSQRQRLLRTSPVEEENQSHNPLQPNQVRFKGVVMLIWLEGYYLLSLVKSYLKAVEYILLAKEIKISSQMSRESNGSAEGDIIKLNRDSVKIDRDKASIADHGISDFSSSVIYPEVGSNSRQEYGSAGTAVNIGFSFKRPLFSPELNLYDWIKILFIGFIGEKNMPFHNIWVNSSGPGTGKDRGVQPGYFLRAFLTASSPVNISFLHTTILWCGYSLTSLSRFLPIKASFSDIFSRILPKSSIHNNNLLGGRSQGILEGQTRPKLRTSPMIEKSVNENVGHSVVDMGTHKEILLSIAPSGGDTLEEQVKSIQAAIDGLINKNDVVKMDIFIRDTGQKKQIRDLFANYYRGSPDENAIPPASSYIEQAPLTGDHQLAVEIIAIPKSENTEITRVNENLTVFRQDGIRFPYVAGIEPDAGIEDTHDQAFDCLEKMFKLLEEKGFPRESVIRTWLFQEDIVGQDGDGNRYRWLNLARREYFRPEGRVPIHFGKNLTVKDLRGNIIPLDSITPPASTGIGISANSFVMEALALLTDREDVHIIFLQNPDQVSAFDYDDEVEVTAPLFSRGLAVVIGDRMVIYISGTASIIGKHSVHLGDVVKQTECTLDNIEKVIGQVGATLEDVPQLRVYIKNKEDYEAVRRVVEARCPNTPVLYLEADVCRPELLVEIEAVAYMQRTSPTETEYKTPEWAKGLRIYYSFLRNSASPKKDQNSFGTFSDLSFIFKHAKRLGFNAVFLMPLCDPAFEGDVDCPYGPLSPYALDPRHIDWEKTSLGGETLLDKWNEFEGNLPADFDDFIAIDQINNYAHVKALRIIKHKIEGYPINDFDKFSSMSPDEIEITEEFQLLHNIILMQQYIARNQLVEGIEYAHRLGLFVGYDQPFFKTMEGVEAKYNASIFERDDEGNARAAGYGLGKDWEQRWGDEASQTGLARYDWDSLKAQDYEPIVDPVRYFFEELEFDFARGDAFHFGYGQEGFYEKMAELCRENNALFIPENLGGGEEVDRRCAELGMLPIDSLSGRGWRGCANFHDRWKWIANYVSARAAQPAYWMFTHHDSSRIMYEYAGLFPEDMPIEIRAKILHTLFGLSMSNYCILFGDEYLDEQRVNKPSKPHNWKTASPYRRPRRDLTKLIKRINEIREKYPYLSDFGNTRFISASESEVVFARHSSDGKKMFICIINPTDDVKEGRVDLKLEDLGVDLEKGFRVSDIFNGHDIEFSKKKENLFDDGSIFYRLNSGAAHVFEIERKEKALGIPVISRLEEALKRFFFEKDGRLAIEAGKPHFHEQEWGRDTMISLIGVIAAGKLDETKGILLGWGSLENEGRIPNVFGWAGEASNSNTSDAALWFIEAVSEYIKTSGDKEILDTEVVEDKTLRDALKNIVKKYSRPRSEVGNEDNVTCIHSDRETGFAWVPKESTWMDTPNTPRKGYPVEIQALWYNALKKMCEIDPNNAAAYSDHAQRIKDNFLEFFWNKEEDTVFDILGTDGIKPAAKATKDPAVRCNQIFAVYFELVEGEHAQKVLESTRDRLLVPGALRSLAQPKKSYKEDTEEPSWPFADYYPYYDMGKPQGERDRAYHNGTGWTWPYAFYWVSAVKEGLVTTEEARRAMTGDYTRLMDDSFTGGHPSVGGSLPELTDATVFELTGENEAKYLYAYPKGCGEQAWSVATAIWGLKEIEARTSPAGRTSPTNSATHTSPATASPREKLAAIAKNLAVMEDPYLRHIEKGAATALRKDPEDLEQEDLAIIAEFNEYMKGTPKQRAARKALGLEEHERIVYASLEYGISNLINIYGGGLGILSGDTLLGANEKYAKDTVVAIGLAYKTGYFKQTIDEDGWQREEYPVTPLDKVGEIVKDVNGNDIVIKVETTPGEFICAKIWKCNVGKVELYLLDTNIEENPKQEDKNLTANLYAKGKDSNGKPLPRQEDSWRFRQELLLGIGGIRALEAMGIKPAAMHMNEGHSALAGIELIKQELDSRAEALGLSLEEINKMRSEGKINDQLLKDAGVTFKAAHEAVKKKCGFTTHTPIPEGNEEFELWLARNYLGNYAQLNHLNIEDIMHLGTIESPVFERAMFSMSTLALNVSRYCNAVSKKHAEVSRKLYGEAWRRLHPDCDKEEYDGDYITNSVFRRVWQAIKLQEFLEGILVEMQGANRLPPEKDIADLDEAEIKKLLDDTPNEALQKVLQDSREDAIKELSSIRGIELDKDAFTIVIARRAATYKRLDLIMSEIEKITERAESLGIKAQIVFAGKAHPGDDDGKAIIKGIVDFAKSHNENVFFIENYNISVSRLLVRIAHIWLNNPIPPQEASGTSGEKAILNGVINLSTPDGWVLEARGEGIVLFKDGKSEDLDKKNDEAKFNLTEKLFELMNIFANHKDVWIQKQKEAIWEGMAHFTMGRFTDQYDERMWAPCIKESKDGFEPASEAQPNIATSPATESKGNILVTGGAGFIGSHAVRELLGQGYNPLIVDNLFKGNQFAVERNAAVARKLGRQFAFEKGDLGEEGFLRDMFGRREVDKVIHFAAFIEVGESVTRPAIYYWNNIRNTMHLLQAMVNAGVLDIVFSSSAAVYGKGMSGEITEEAPTIPINPYGFTKLMMEKIIAYYADQYGMRWQALRYFNVADASQDGDIGEAHPLPESHLIPAVIAMFAKGKLPYLLGDDYPTRDGTCLRDYVSVIDLAIAHVLAIELLNNRPYNLGSGIGYTVKEIIKAVAEVMEVKADWVVKPPRSGDPDSLLASYAAFSEATGWQPTMSRNIYEVIGRAVKWYKNKPAESNVEKPIPDADEGEMADQVKREVERDKVISPGLKHEIIAQLDEDMRTAGKVTPQEAKSQNDLVDTLEEKGMAPSAHWSTIETRLDKKVTSRERRIILDEEISSLQNLRGRSSPMQPRFSTRNKILFALLTVASFASSFYFINNKIIAALVAVAVPTTIFVILVPGRIICRVFTSDTLSFVFRQRDKCRAGEITLPEAIDAITNKIFRQHAGLKEAKARKQAQKEARQTKQRRKKEAQKKEKREAALNQLLSALDKISARKFADLALLEKSMNNLAAKHDKKISRRQRRQARDKINDIMKQARAAKASLEKKAKDVKAAEAQAIKDLEERFSQIRQKLEERGLSWFRTQESFELEVNRAVERSIPTEMLQRSSVRKTVGNMRNELLKWGRRTITSLMDEKQRKERERSEGRRKRRREAAETQQEKERQAAEEARLTREAEETRLEEERKKAEEERQAAEEARLAKEREEAEERQKRKREAEEQRRRREVKEAKKDRQAEKKKKAERRKQSTRKAEQKRQLAAKQKKEEVAGELDTIEGFLDPAQILEDYAVLLENLDELARHGIFLERIERLRQRIFKMGKDLLLTKYQEDVLADMSTEVSSLFRPVFIKANAGDIESAKALWRYASGKLVELPKIQKMQRLGITSGKEPKAIEAAMTELAVLGVIGRPQSNTSPATEMVQQIISNGLYEPLDGKRESRLRGKIIEKLQRKLDSNDTLRQKVLQPVQSRNWAVFEGVVASVKNATQKGGKDDYCLVYYDKDRKTLFIAREVLFGFPLDLAVELLFRELSKNELSSREISSIFRENYTNDARTKNNGLLSDHIAQLLAGRAVSHYLTEPVCQDHPGLVDIYLEFGAQLIDSKNRDENLSDELKRHFEAQLQEVLDAIYNLKPRSLRKSLLEPVERMGRIAFYPDLYNVLGKMGVWTTLFHLLIKEARMNLAAGNIEELIFNIQDRNIIRYLGTVNEPDQWLIAEEKLLLKEFTGFIEETNAAIEEMFAEFQRTLGLEDIEEAQRLKTEFTNLKQSFEPGIHEPQLKGIVDSLSAKIEEMEAALPAKTSPLTEQTLKDHVIAKKREETSDAVETSKDMLVSRWRDKLNLVLAVARAVSAYHKEGILIKELTWNNIMVRPDGSIYVITHDNTIRLDQAPEDIPSISREIQRSEFSERPVIFINNSPHDLERLKDFLTVPLNIYNFGLNMALILDVSGITRCPRHHDFEAAGTLTNVLSRLDRDVQEYISYASVAQNEDDLEIYRAIADSFRIAVRCLVDRTKRYPDMDSVIADLEDCINRLSRTSPAEEPAGTSAEETVKLESHEATSQLERRSVGAWKAISRATGIREDADTVLSFLKEYFMEHPESVRVVIPVSVLYAEMLKTIDYDFRLWKFLGVLKYVVAANGCGWFPTMKEDDPETFVLYKEWLDGEKECDPGEHFILRDLPRRHAKPIASGEEHKAATKEIDKEARIAAIRRIAGEFHEKHRKKPTWGKVAKLLDEEETDRRVNRDNLHKWLANKDIPLSNFDDCIQRGQTKSLVETRFAQLREIIEELLLRKKDKDPRPKEITELLNQRNPDRKDINPQVLGNWLRTHESSIPELIASVKSDMQSRSSPTTEEIESQVKLTLKDELKIFFTRLPKDGIEVFIRVFTALVGIPGVSFTSYKTIEQLVVSGSIPTQLLIAAPVSYIVFAAMICLCCHPIIKHNFSNTVMLERLEKMYDDYYTELTIQIKITQENKDPKRFTSLYSELRKATEDCNRAFLMMYNFLDNLISKKEMTEDEEQRAIRLRTKVYSIFGKLFQLETALGLFMPSIPVKSSLPATTIVKLTQRGPVRMKINPDVREERKGESERKALDDIMNKLIRNHRVAKIKRTSPTEAANIKARILVTKLEYLDRLTEVSGLLPDTGPIPMGLDGFAEKKALSIQTISQKIDKVVTDPEEAMLFLIKINNHLRQIEQAAWKLERIDPKTDGYYKEKIRGLLESAKEEAYMLLAKLEALSKGMREIATTDSTRGYQDTALALETLKVLDKALVNFRKRISKVITKLSEFEKTLRLIILPAPLRRRNLDEIERTHTRLNHA